MIHKRVFGKTFHQVLRRFVAVREMIKSITVCKKVLFELVKPALQIK